MRWGLLALAVGVVLSGCQTASQSTPPTAAQAEIPAAAEPLATPEAAADADALAPAPELLITEPAVTDVWQRIRAGLQFADVENEDVRVQRDWYLRNQDYMNRVAERADLYLYYITGELEKRGLPLDLALLPIVESAYQPYAYSRARAAGMWQFIPSTGRLYDLDINWWQDGRRDVVRSTEAAMDYLERLNRMFDGDWLLALAAYNAGEGSVTRAMEKNRKKGLATDFWSLKLKSETSAYVPKMIALTQLLRDPQKYQFSWRPIANEARFARVEIGSQLDLKLASELAGISSEQMYQLNPHFARWATDPQGPHELLIPIDSVERFRSALETLPPEKRVQWGTYTVKSGDTLGAIAKKHRTSVAQLQRSNHIKGTNIRKGQTLLIPKQGGNPTRDMQLADAPRAQTRHDSQGRHTVQEGENLWSIARANGLTVAELRKRNALDEGSLLKVGQVLYVGPTAQGAQTTAASLTGNPHLSTRKMQYTVRSGDSLARIASKFGVSVRELSQWNNWDRNRVLKPGQRLTIYVDQTRLSGG